MTQVILDDLCRIPLSQRLSPTIDKNPTNVTPSGTTATILSRVPATAVEEPVNNKLTIHVTASEKEQFLDLAKETGVTQRQCLMLLMENAKTDVFSNPDWTANEYVRLMLRVYKERIAQLEDQVQSLKSQLKVKEQEERTTRTKREEAMYQGLQHYYQYFRSTLDRNNPLPRCLYKDYLAVTPPDQAYRYPTTTEPFVFYPEGIMLGKGKGHIAPIFIAGQNNDHQKLLLRYYPKPYHVGPTLTNIAFGLCGSCWLVRCEQSKDGAMDVILTLPLDIALDTEPSGIFKGDRIDDILHNALQRSR